MIPHISSLPTFGIHRGVGHIRGILRYVKNTAEQARVHMQPQHPMHINIFHLYNGCIMIKWGGGGGNDCA